MPTAHLHAIRVLAAIVLVSLTACQSPAPLAPTVVPTTPTTSALPPTPAPPTPHPATPTPNVKTVPTPPPFDPTPVGQTLDPHFGVAEGFRNAAVMSDIGAGWERVVLSWADIQPDGPDDFTWLGRTMPPRALAGELNRGVRIAGLLQFTPDWAATDSQDPGRSVPKNLDLPEDDPNNYWARFVYETVHYYAGRIDEWIIWNEPEFKSDDAAGSGTITWLGSDEQFARLMQVAYLSAKRANPKATIAFPGTSYWVDHNAGRPQFYERFLAIVSQDPAAKTHGFYHDAVPLNLYRAPDDLVRLHAEFKDIQKRHAVDAPVWLLELNAMPTDDQSIPCAERHSHNPIQTTQQEQAAYAIQAFALAAAVDYQRIGFYQMVDDNPCVQSAVWGITRDDGTERPVATTLQTAVQAFSGFTRAQFAPLVRAQARWSAWPGDPNSLLPNWQVYQVVFDLPARRRVSVLWSGDGAALRVRVARHGTRAQILDEDGTSTNAIQNGQDWLVTLPAATAHFPGDPNGYFFIGGEPRLLIEEDVPPGATVAPPRLA